MTKLTPLIPPAILCLCVLGIAIWLRLPQVLLLPAVDPVLRHAAEHPNWRLSIDNYQTGLGAPVSKAIIDPMVTLTGTEYGSYVYEFSTEPGARYYEYRQGPKVRWCLHAPDNPWRIPNVHIQRFEHGMVIGPVPKWCSMAPGLCSGVFVTFADDGLFDIAEHDGTDCPTYEDVEKQETVSPEPQASWFARQKK
jgi:hypothetical protein